MAKYSEELKRQVRQAHMNLCRRYPRQPRFGDGWTSNPALRTEFIQEVRNQGCDENEDLILDCFLYLRKKGQDSPDGLRPL